jgi:N-acetyl sugar amidotransferase
MNPYPKYDDVNDRLFEADDTTDLPIKYGLPGDVEFCKKCVISNQRPNSAVETKHTSESLKETIGFNSDGICDPCRLAENKKAVIDWEDKDKELRELCDRYRKEDGSYDCLVPGSGGKDSFFQSHILKYKYNMNPLTVTWAPHIYTDWGWKNFQSWIGSGFDNYLMTPNTRVHRLVTRLAVEKLLHPFQPFMIGQKNFAPKIADLFNIPLVFYGENEAEYGNPLANSNSALRSANYFSSKDRRDIYIGGVSTKELKEDYGLKEVDIEPYLPIDESTLKNKNIEVHYLGYYIPWHPQGAYYYAVENGGFIPSPERTPGTYSKYNSIDDKIDDYHYYTTYIKFGIGRATYDAAQEIRNDEITREEGIALVRKYDGEYPTRFEDEIFQYLSINENEFPKASSMFEQPIMTRDYFDDLCNTFRSPHLWKKGSDGWILRSTVF